MVAVIWELYPDFKVFSQSFLCQKNYEPLFILKNYSKINIDVWNALLSQFHSYFMIGIFT